jgi:malonyl-CoA decarboxylase
MSYDPASEIRPVSDPSPGSIGCSPRPAFDLPPLGALIDQRRQLLDRLGQHPELAAMEAELSVLLQSVLNTRGLRLLRLDRDTPTSILDQIVKHENVHRIRDSQDLARRLADDRRCFGLFHPALPGEPLIFTTLALTRGLSASAGSLLDAESPLVEPSTCDCAIFYSINSCHEGLKGVSLGNALIDQVTNELASAFPRLNTFATLSPVPGFRSWLATLAQSPSRSAASDVAAAALSTLVQPDWCRDASAAAELKGQLVPLCAYYLIHVKRGEDPADPVARFHFRNGARLERINWLSDSSAASLNRSAGLMVNYLYRRTAPRRRYDAASHVRSLQVSPQVARLAGRAASLFNS